MEDFALRTRLYGNNPIFENEWVDIFREVERYQCIFLDRGLHNGHLARIDIRIRKRFIKTQGELPADEAIPARQKRVIPHD